MARASTAIRFGWIPVLLAAAYVGWVFYSRQAETKRLQREAAAETAAQLRETLKNTGGEQLKILTFYASPPSTTKGQPTLLCYGVANADRVRIEPNGPQISPSLSQCVEAKPSRSTVYKLVAQSGTDRKVEAETTVTVR